MVARCPHETDRQGSQRHGAGWSGAMGQTVIDRAERPVRGPGESDLTGVAGGDVCAHAPAKSSSCHKPIPDQGWDAELDRRVAASVPGQTR